MKPLKSVIGGYLKDIRKRAAKEYADGFITVEELNKVVDACDILSQIAESSKESEGVKFEGN